MGGSGSGAKRISVRWPRWSRMSSPVSVGAEVQQDLPIQRVVAGGLDHEGIAGGIADAHDGKSSESATDSLVSSDTGVSFSASSSGRTVSCSRSGS
jgi:hypothetical protein